VVIAPIVTAMLIVGSTACGTTGSGGGQVTDLVSLSTTRAAAGTVIEAVFIVNQQSVRLVALRYGLPAAASGEKTDGRSFTAKARSSHGCILSRAR
jgi:hypothetical protein